MPAEVAAQVLEYMRTDLLPPEAASTLDAETPLLDGLLDSFAVMQLITFLEDRYGIVVSAEETSAEHFMNVSLIEALIVRKTAEGTSPAHEDDRP